MFAEDGEETRLCATIDDIIASGELKSTSLYEKFKSKLTSSGGTLQERKKGKQRVM